MGAVTAQWTLSQTATDVIRVSTGLLAAATSDNVQMLALLACEAFGATLAMSPNVCHKVYLLGNKGNENAWVTFFKAQVGYRAGGCGWQLAQNEAGIRFLGLTACLTTMDHWEANRDCGRQEINSFTPAAQTTHLGPRIPISEVRLHGERVGMEPLDSQFSSDYAKGRGDGN